MSYRSSQLSFVSHKLHVGIRTIILLIGVLGIIILSISQSANAQSYPPVYNPSTHALTPPSEQPGAPAGSYPLSGFENVNLFNGNLSFALPLMQVGGRGGAGYTMTLPIEQQWQVQTIAVPSNCGPSGCSYQESDYRYIANPIWWTGIKPGFGPGVLQGRKSGANIWYPQGCGGGVYGNTLTRLTFTGPDGSEIELRDLASGGNPNLSASGCNGGPSRGRIFVSADGSAATFFSNSEIFDERQPMTPNVFYPTGYLLLRDGTRYFIENGNTSWIRDRNGNMVTFEYAGANSTGPITKIKDSLNREINISGGVITFKGTNGATRTLKVFKNALSTVLRKYPNGSPEYTIKTFAQLFPNLQNIQQGNFDIQVTTAVELPDGRKYEFRYDSYANLAQIILPTGGRIEYDWYTTALQFSDHVFSIHKRVIERRTAVDTTTSVFETLTRYSNPLVQGGDNITVDVLDPKNSNALIARSKHYFHGSPLNHPEAQNLYPAWQDGMEWKTESYAPGASTPLRRVTKTWRQKAAISWWTGDAASSPPNDPRLVETVTELTDVTPNLVSKVSAIDPNNSSVVGFDQYNNPTDVWEYDFGSGAVGALKRHTQTTYLTSQYDTINPNTTSPNLDTTYHLRSLPTQVSIFDAGSIERARTTFEYDNYSGTFHAGLIDRASITGHDSGFGTGYVYRGNLTATTGHLLQTAASISSYLQYDIAGNVVKAIDPRSTSSNIIATTIEYDDNFGSPDNVLTDTASISELGSMHTWAFPTSSTNPKNFTAYSQYDYYLGTAINTKDINGTISAAFHADTLDRLTQVKSAIGTLVERQVTFAYNDTNREITTSRDLDTLNDNVLVNKALYDGLGRTTETRKYTGVGTYIKVLTEYDAMGRAYRVSNPFVSGESALWTTTTFDSLGRVRFVTTPDSAVVQTQYSGNTVTVLDQLSKQRSSVTDALGRLVKVWEAPNDSNFNYLTIYEYDVLDSLTKVIQDNNPSSPEQPPREFTYDSLKRLTSAKNPESGTVNYDYDKAGNLIQKTDARGVVATYVYDDLSRNTSITYSNDPSGTLPVTRVYDTAINGKGRLHQSQTTGTGGSLTTISAYDALGRPTSQSQQFFVSGSWSTSYTTSRSYNLADLVKSIGYPSGNSVTYNYDPAGRLADKDSSHLAFTGNLGDGTLRTYSEGILYSPLGGMVKEKFGTTTSVYNKLFYNTRGQLSEIRVGTTYTGPTDGGWNRGAIINHYSDGCWGSCGGSNIPTSMTDNNGNLRKQEIYIPNDDAISSYSMRWLDYNYDSLNRITSAREIYNGTEQWKQGYTYDRYGNRTIDTGVTYGGVNNKAFSKDINTNRLGVPSGQSGTMHYDAAGNLDNDTYSGNGTRSYNAENKMISAQDSLSGTSYYTYNADGQRVRRKIGTTETWAIYGLDGEMLAEYPASGSTGSPEKEYGYRNGQLLVVATPASSSGGGGKSISLNGTSNHAEVPNSSSLNQTGAFTVEAWIKLPSASTAYQPIVDKSPSLGVEGGYSLFVTESSKLRFDVFYGTYYYGLIGNITLTANSWHHVAGVYDGTQIRLYVDGQLDVSGTPPSAMTTCAVQLRIGKNNYLYSPLYFGGLIDEVRVSTGALYSSTFTPSNNLSASGSTRGLWKFDGQNVNDSSSNGNNGTLVSGTYSTDVPGGGGGGGGTPFSLNWLVADQLGTPRIVLDLGGSLANVKRHDYLPFGEEIIGLSGRSAANGYGGGDGVRQQFTAKERDNETGFDYFFARYYSATPGRFTSADPSNPGGVPNDPQSWHGYAYARNNPLKYQDPDGKSFKICDPQGNCSIVSDDDAKKYTFNKQYQKQNGYSTRGDGKIYGADGGVIGTYQNLGCDCWSDQQNRMVSGIAEELGNSTNLFLGAAAAVFRTRLRPIKPINLPASRHVLVDMVEVATGHMHGGERAVQSLRSGKGKSLFSQWMTPTQVESAIIDAYEHSTVTRVQGSRVVLQGVTKDGSKIEMWFNRETKVIETAYPISKN